MYFFLLFYKKRFVKDKIDLICKLWLFLVVEFSIISLEIEDIFFVIKLVILYFWDFWGYNWIYIKFGLISKLW